MQKVGISQVFSKIIQAQLKSSILYAKKSYGVKSGFNYLFNSAFYMSSLQMA